MSTPIEIVRAQNAWWERALGGVTHYREEYTAALASVLADAERYKALEAVFAGHNNEGNISAFPWKGGRMFYYSKEPDIDGSTLAELADRLRKET